MAVPQYINRLTTMKRLALFILGAILFSEVNSYAQFRIGITSGLDINYPVSDALYQCPSPGYSLGLVGMCSFSNSLGIKAELLGSDIRYGYTKIDSEQVSAIQQSKMNIIAVPVQGIWRMELANNLFLCFGVGVQYSRLCSGSAYICDQYGQGELWELDSNYFLRFDFPEYHEIHLNGVESNLYSGVASIEVSGKHFSTGLFVNKGINSFATALPFVSGQFPKTLDKIGVRLSYYL